MTPAPRPIPDAPQEGLDPALLQVIRAMARAQARRDFDAARRPDDLPSGGG